MIVSFHGISSSVSRSVEEVELTINITGLPEDYELYVDNVLWVNKKKKFPTGTILLDVTPTVEGYSIIPTSVSSVTLDTNKTLTFNAIAIPTGRKWSLNIGGQFTSDVSESGIIWNNWKATNAQLGTIEGYTVSNMKTEDNVTTTLSVTNSGAFTASSNALITYSSTSPVYPKIAVESGITLANPTGFKFSGADPTKTYKVSVFCCTATAGDIKTTISFGGQTSTHNAQNNLPIDGENRYISSSLATLIDVTPDSNGVFTIGISRGGAYFQTVVNLILIQEI